MKLLIITQVIDTEHPILGFFHRWVEEFAKHYESVEVICLQEGKHALPANVTVHSLGKEGGQSRLKYLYRFYTLIWQLRHSYDHVFVHMNQIYVIIGALVWRAMGKRVGLWYAHGAVSVSLKMAEKLTCKIFTASTESFRLRSSKLFVTGHGIDVARFSPMDVPKNLDLVTVGRITKSKNLLTLIDALRDIQKKQKVSLAIVGMSVTDEEKEYEKRLCERIKEYDLENAVMFTGRLSQEELPTYLSQAKVFVTVAQNGSLDKAMLEAMACGLPVVSMAPGSMSLPLGDNQVADKDGFVTAVLRVLESGVYLDQRNIDCIVNNHSIKSLIPKIAGVLES